MDFSPLLALRELESAYEQELDAFLIFSAETA
jgi:hypothetical protein